MLQQIQDSNICLSHEATTSVMFLFISSPSAMKTDSRGLHVDKPHRLALTGSNPTTHLAPAFRLLHTLQVNLKPLYTGFPFTPLCRLMLLLFVIKQLNRSVSPHSRSIGFRGNCVGVLRTLQFP